MSYQNKRFIFDIADARDGEKIAEILESNPFEGRISLLYTRRPDAYESFLKESKESEVLICRDKNEGGVVGFGAYNVRELYVNGIPQRVGYIFGLRGYGQYLKSYPLLHKAFDYLYQRCQDRQISFYITTILNYNLYSRRLLEKRRKFMPSYEFYGDYEIFALKTFLRKKKYSGLTFRKATLDDVTAIVKFLNQEGRQYQFFPLVKEEDLLEERLPNLSINHFYLVVDNNNEILTAGAAWDQKRYKQYIVQGYGLSIKFINTIGIWFPLLNWPLLPPKGQMLNFFTLSFWAVKGNEETVFDCFLEGLSHVSKEYSFFLVGVYETHPLRAHLKHRRCVTYKSKAYLVDWEKEINPLTKLNNDFIPYLECGLL